VNIVGIDPRETLVGNLAIKINHKGFDTKAQVWMKICDGIGEWNKVAYFSCRFFFTSYIPYCCSFKDLGKR
jgi:hypothetical protein